MTADARARPGWLAYWRLSAADRRAVRHIERTCRAAGDPQLDAIALTRLRRTARRTRLLGPFGRTLSHGCPPPQERLARLCSTMRHPSRTGLCAGPPSLPNRPRTS